MKYRFLILLFIISTAGVSKSSAQETQAVKSAWVLNYFFNHKDNSFDSAGLRLQHSFSTEGAANAYIKKLPDLLYDQGYITAAVDSVGSDAGKKSVFIFLGDQYTWAGISTDSVEQSALDAVRFLSRNYNDKKMSMGSWQLLKERLLRYYANSGYPFAEVYLDSIQLLAHSVRAQLRVKKGLWYPIDSIRVLGKAKLSSHFLQRYLGISNGSAYNQTRLSDVDKRIKDLPYVNAVQPSDLTMLGQGAVLNLYLEPKKSSQVNFLIGFMPSSGEGKKMQITGDVNLDLKNMLGSGESILIKWQQLQVKSPRLNLGYNHPYILNSSFGLDFLFDLFKKDSSYLQLNAQLGADYLISSAQTAKIFVQWQNTGLLQGGVDTNAIKISKQLPPNIDVKSTNLGLSYLLQKTNYRFNPRSGNELKIGGTVGIKRVSKNTDIISIKDPLFNYETLYDSVKPRVYQLRAEISGAHYFPIGKLSVIKAAFQGALYLSPSIFRNDLFQIGGFKTLRGFDEESIYATRYGVATLEYRNLLSLNSYLFFFADLGVTKNKYQQVNIGNRFLGLGLGLVYETKLGLLNVSYGMGMRNDLPFNIRKASKLHFGYVNYF